MNQAYFINFIIHCKEGGHTSALGRVSAGQRNVPVLEGGHTSALGRISAGKRNVPVNYNGSRFWYDEICDDVPYFIDCVERMHC